MSWQVSESFANSDQGWQIKRGLAHIDDLLRLAISELEASAAWLKELDATWLPGVKVVTLEQRAALAQARQAKAAQAAERRAAYKARLAAATDGVV